MVDKGWKNPPPMIANDKFWTPPNLVAVLVLLTLDIKKEDENEGES